MELKYLLFDQRAIATLVSRNVLQSVEYLQGEQLVRHFCGEEKSGILENIYIEHKKDGILFIGKQSEISDNAEKWIRIFCVDLTTCGILSEREHPAALLTIMQKTFRTVLKIWDRQPLSFSEKINQTKTIVFPFVMPDHRRVVIERSNNIPRLTKRNIKQPLLAYKYSAEDPHGEDIVNTDILCRAAMDYIERHYLVQKNFSVEDAENDVQSVPIGASTGNKLEGKDSFAYWTYDMQYANLTESQKYIVDFENLESPLRVDGAAGTGKTVSLIMRAYRLLVIHKDKKTPFRIIFFSHSVSACELAKAIFSHYEFATSFMQEDAQQNIRFVTLLDYCKEYTRISNNSLLEPDAGDSKSYQLLIIENVLTQAKEKSVINTYRPLLSERMRKTFSNITEASMQNICSLLQHEFSIQIKGRTDCTFEKYQELPSIPNGLSCESKADKEFVFRLFTDYQKMLSDYNNFDVDDVVLEALSRLNAPVWRRRREEDGYDYIFVDEMHLFNINEQSVFHYLTRDYSSHKIPICFALDYCQAVGDRGNTDLDYIENEFGKLEKKKYYTVFRNSPQIAAFCASIAASGVLMFQESFINPYDISQNNFTEQEEKKSQIEPVLYMYQNDDSMIKSLDEHLNELMKNLQCKQKDIVIISFEPDLVTKEGAALISKALGRKFVLLDENTDIDENGFLLASPRAINGLEFQAVILLGVDEGRVPQTIGTDDISSHFVRYSAYNQLYLTASRAKYRLVILGSNLNGRSSCLEHSIASGYLNVVDKVAD